MFGLRPTIPGWSKWRVKIAPGNLKFAEIKTPTPYGPIVQNFTKTNDGKFIFHLKEMPYGTIAEEICLPNFKVKTKTSIVDKNEEDIIYIAINGEKVRARYDNLKYKTYACVDNVKTTGVFVL